MELLAMERIETPTDEDEDWARSLVLSEEELRRKYPHRPDLLGGCCRRFDSKNVIDLAGERRRRLKA